MTSAVMKLMRGDDPSCVGRFILPYILMERS